ncbi:MAG TPA: DUF924 family protein [Devosiaceae bacterium]|nr:DUF924 family protein [Devosiaceae bacterium]
MPKNAATTAKSVRRPATRVRSAAASKPARKSAHGKTAPKKTQPRKATARDVIAFWFAEHGEKDWFAGGRKFDALIKKRFAETRERAVRGELADWRKNAEGRLAEIIVLDQFSRQIYRGRPQAFAADPVALVLAQEAIAGGADAELEPHMRLFMYMPFMHSESLQVHRTAMRLFRTLGDKSALSFERAHRDVIARFGRYPLRNTALGRKSTRAELAYAKDRENGTF